MHRGALHSAWTHFDFPWNAEVKLPFRPGANVATTGGVEDRVRVGDFDRSSPASEDALLRLDRLAAAAELRTAAAVGRSG